MENKEVEVVEIDGLEVMILDEDDDVIYGTDASDPANVVILKKEEDNLIKLNGVDELPYLEKFLEKNGNLVNTEC